MKMVTMHQDALQKASAGIIFARRNSPGFLRRPRCMNAFRYQAIGDGGASIEGIIEAEDRKTALRLLGQRGLFPAHLEACVANGRTAVATASAPSAPSAGFQIGGRVGRKDITSSPAR